MVDADVHRLGDEVDPHTVALEKGVAQPTAESFQIGREVDVGGAAGTQYGNARSEGR